MPSMPSRASSFLTGGSNSSIKCFEIRVDEDHLVFRGNADEASSSLLKGTLVICNSEPIKNSGIHLRLQGIARTSVAIQAASGTRFEKQETTFLDKKWDFDNQNDNKKQQNILPAGNHEWPFEFILRGDLPESVEGMPFSYVIYRLKATMDRGAFAKDVLARRHIRLIRTFNIDSLDLSHAMSVENIWPNKIQYNVSTPTKGVMFGTQVRVDFELTPLLKGLQLGKIKSEINESQEVKVNNKSGGRIKKDERVVTTDEYEIPEYVEAEDIDGQEGYRFSRYLQLPRKLQQCLQTVEVQNINIKHNIKFTVQLINPDGHLSELRASLPLHIFISPSLRLNERHELTTAASATPTGLDASTLAPPGYGDHQLDPLYDGVDPRGFMTPGPGTPFDRSRRNSTEDLSLDALANTEVSANTLHNRLINLTTTDPVSGRRSAVSGATTPAAIHSTPGDYGSPPRNSTTSDYFTSPGSHSGGVSRSSSGDRINQLAYQQQPGHAQLPSQGQTHSPPSSGTHSPGQRSGPQTPMHLEAPSTPATAYNSDMLSRVPSYNTAVHSNPRTPFSNDLPDYFSATSRPPTPPSETPSGAGSGTTTPSDGNGAGVQPVHSRHAHFTDAPPETHTIERRGQGERTERMKHLLPAIRARH